jgi:hypothetical protein
MPVRAPGWLLVAALVLLPGWPPGGAAQPSVTGLGRAGLGDQCLEDTDCQSHFCDRHRCATPEGVYGRACIPAPRTPEGPRDGKLHTCGAYLCIHRRCRSCESNAACQSELGAPRCYRAPQHPGARCGDPRE